MQVEVKEQQAKYNSDLLGWQKKPDGNELSDLNRKYTKLYNDLDDLWPSLSLSAQAVLRVVIRHSIGFHQKSFKMSLVKFREKTGIKSDHTIIKALQELEKEKAISIKKYRQKQVNEYTFLL